MYNYIKALHIIFVVTWFSGMFYVVRLYIYNTEAAERESPAKEILQSQFRLMIKRLWWGITWPSAILTVLFGGWMWYLLNILPSWLIIKFSFVLALFAYHLSLHYLYRQQMAGIFRYSSQKLRLWNEVATMFLVVIVMLAAVKESMSWINGLVIFILSAIILLFGVKIYRKVRK